MATDDQLSELLGKNADLFAAYEEWSNGQIMLLAGTVDDPNSFNEAGGKTGALGYYPVVNVSGQTIYVACIARLKAIALGGANAAVLEGLVGQVGGKLASVDAAIGEVLTAGGFADDRAAFADQQGKFAKAQGDAIGDISAAVAASGQNKADAQTARAGAEAARDQAGVTINSLRFTTTANGYAYGKRGMFARIGSSGGIGDFIADDGYHYAKYAIRVLGAGWTQGSDGFWSLDLSGLALTRYAFPSGESLDGASGTRYYGGKRVRYAIVDGLLGAALVVADDGTVTIPKLVSPAVDFSGLTYSKITFTSGDAVSVSGQRYHAGQPVRWALADGNLAAALVLLGDGTVSIPKLSSPALDLAGGSAALDAAGYVFSEVVYAGTKQLQRASKSGGKRSLATSAGNNFAPRLSADGSKVIYISDRTGTKESWYQLLDGSKFGGAVEHPVMPYLRMMTSLGDSLTAGGMGEKVAGTFGVGLSTPASASVVAGGPTAGGGIGSQKSDQVAARFGAAPMTCSLAGNAVSAGANLLTAISIFLLSRASDTAGAVRTLRASILGVSGVLTSTQQADVSANGALAYAGQGYVYTFTPDAGQVLPGSVPAGTALMIDPENRQDCPLLLWIGRNNVGSGAGWQAEVKSRIAAVVAAHKPLVRNIVIVGVTNATNEPAGSTNYNEIVALNLELAALYPDSFVDVRPAYNAGTADDTPAPALTADGLHYNNAGSVAIAAVVSAFITAKGWFS